MIIFGYLDFFHSKQVSQVQMERILGYIEKGKAEGATLSCGGKRKGTKGYFVEPTVFSDVTDDMTIAKEEASNTFCSFLCSLCEIFTQEHFFFFLCDLEIFTQEHFFFFLCDLGSLLM